MKESNISETETDTKKLPFHKLTRYKSNSISESYVKSLKGKPDYIYEINFSKDSKLQKIGPNFLRNLNLYSITLPPSLTIIRPRSMNKLRHLFQITFLKDDHNENFLEVIGSSALRETDIESISIPENIRKIGSYCFPKCLKKIEFEKGAPKLKSIGDNAFNSTQIETFYMPSNITPFFNTHNIFSHCNSLNKIVFDNYIDKENPPSIDYEDEKKEEEKIIKEKREFKEKIQKWATNTTEKVEKNDSIGYEPSLDLAKSFILCETNIKFIEIFISNLNYFYFFNTPNLTSIEIPANSNGRYIKQNGCLYTKDKRKLIVAERNIQNARIFSDCKIITNFAFNFQSFEKVSFENNSELQEISIFAFSESNIEEVVIPDSVELINFGAFYKCEKLEKVNIPRSIDTIDFVTFSYSKITEITIPKNVIRIKYGCFCKCSKLAKVDFKKDSNLVEIDDYAFAGTNIESISIPKSVRTIGNYCFTDCSNLKSISFEENSELLELGLECFSGTQIKEFHLPQKIQKFDFTNTEAIVVTFSEQGSFRSLKNFQLSMITQICIPSSVEIISPNAFLGCQSLTEVRINDFSNSKLEVISEGAFYDCISLNKFELPKMICSFGRNCFKNCINYKGQVRVMNDKRIIVGDNAFCNSGIIIFQAKSPKINIGDYAFENCQSIIQFSAEAEKECILGLSSFFDCNSLLEVNLLNNTETAAIGESCFMNSSIKTFEIPIHLTVIPKFCFKGCVFLREVTIYENSEITIFSREAFSNSNVESIFIPSKTKTIEEICFKNCKKLKGVTFSDELDQCIIENCAFYNSGIEILHVPRGITKIRESCFQKCTNLKKVSFSEELSFTSIEEQVFHSSGLKTITIPSCIKLIKTSAFQDCQQLHTVNILSENILISQYAFSGCKKLQTIKCRKPITIMPVNSVDYFYHPPVYAKLTQKQIDKTIIRTLFTNSKTYFQTYQHFNFSYTLLFDIKWHLSTDFDCYSCFKRNKLMKYKIMEYQDGGYYSKCMQKLCFCDFSTQKITVPKETKSIESNAFQHTNLKQIQFENDSHLKTIKKFAFEHLQIKQITIPDSCTFIGDFAFSNCHSLENVIIKSTSHLVTIGKHAFEKTAINSILFPSTLTTVSDYAFFECFNLTKVENRSFKIDFGYQSFYRSSIEKIAFPLTSVFHNSSFKNCMKLKQLSFIEKGQNAIFEEESFAFSGLIDIDIRCHAEIKENAFINCPFLKKISLSGKNIKCSRSSFANSNAEICKLKLNLDGNQSKKQLEQHYFEDIFKSNVDQCTVKLTCSDNSTEFRLDHKCYSVDNTLIYADLIDNIMLTKKQNLETSSENIKRNEIISVPAYVKKLDFPVMSHAKKIFFQPDCALEDMGPPGFFSYYNLTEITIPKLVKQIPPYLFEHCHYLSDLKFEEGSILNEIGEYSFSNTKLIRVCLPNSVQIIRKSAFSDNLNLKEVIFEGETIENEAFARTGIISFTLSNNTKVIGSSAFQECHSLTTFNIDLEKSNLREIGSYAFAESSIISINIPAFVNVIKSFTFAACQSLKEVNISPQSNLEKIEPEAFTSNTSLTKITIPKSLLHLFEKSFVQKPTLHSITHGPKQSFSVEENKNAQCSLILNFSEENNINTYNNNCYVVDHELIYADLIDNSILYEKPQNKHKEILKSNEILKVPINTKKLNFPVMSHIRRILWSTEGIVEDLGPAGAFSHYNLTQFTVPKSVQVIPPHIFENCHFLKVLMFQDESTLKEIGEYSFANTQIRKVNFPESVKIIRKSAFFNNLHLRDVIFKGEIIGESAFAQTGITLFRLSNNVTSIGEGAFRDCHSLQKFKINIEKSNLLEIGSHAFSETSIKTINIPSSIKVIKSFAFSGCRKLQEVKISDKSTLEIIEKYAFSENLELQKINIPQTIKKLSHKAFINTPSLQTIMTESNQCFYVMEDNSIYSRSNNLVFVPRNLTKYKVIRNCLMINSGAFCGPNLEEVSFSDDSLIKIEKCGFAHSTGLKTITIPRSVQYIGNEAFIDCQNLENVDFESGSKFKQISKFCFAFSALKKINLPPSLEVINHSSFFYCRNLKTVNLESTNLKFIGDYAFSNTNVSEVKLPSSIEFIGNNAFGGNESINLIDLTNISSIEETDDYSAIKKYQKESTRITIHQESSAQFSPPPPNYDQSVRSPRRASNKIPGISALLDQNPRVVKPSPDRNKKVSIINSPKVNVSHVLPPPRPKFDLSPRRVYKRVDNFENACHINIKANINENENENTQNSSTKKCFINNNAFCMSSIKTFKFNLEKLDWFNFLESCNQIDRYIVNSNLSLSLQKLGKENKNDYLFGSLFRIRKLKIKNHGTIPTMRNQLLTECFITKATKRLKPNNFSFCSQLTNVTFDDGIRIKSIPKHCFTYSSLKEISIPASVESINRYAFHSCSCLETVNFASNSKLKMIQEGAFSNCENLKSVFIPANVEAIKKFAFMSCSKLEKVSFLSNNKLRIIQEGAFSECKKLTSINIPFLIEVIPDNCFSFTGLESIILPSSVKKIGSRSFFSCKDLKKIVLNEGILELGEFSFANDVSLSTVDFPDSLKTIKSNAFMDCLNLKKVNTTEKTKLVEIYDGAFENTKIDELLINRSAKKLFAPRNVPQLNKISFCQGKPVHFIQLKDGSIYEKQDSLIGNAESSESEIEANITNDFVKSTYYYFKSYDKSLLEKEDYHKIYTQKAKEILIQKNRSRFSPDELEKHPFLKLVFVPKNAKRIQIHEDCFSISNSILDGMQQLTTLEYMNGITNSIIDFPSNNHLRTRIKEIKISGQFCTLEEKVFAHFKSLEKVEFSDQTNLFYIPKHAFLGCESLREVSLPSSCYSIEEGAFKDCSKLTKFEIRTNKEKKLKFIRKDAFCNCTSLEQISIPSSIFAICEGAFMNCSNLKTINIEKSSKETLEIIEKNAFKNCMSLLSFTLPSSCVYLGPASFMNCTNMKSFEYRGTILQSIQSRTFLNCISLEKVEFHDLQIECKSLLAHFRYTDNEFISEVKKKERYSRPSFFIGSESFMNCSSLKKVVFEDKTKDIKTVKYDKNKLPNFVYPLYKFNKLHCTSNLFMTTKRQTVQRKAFANCKALSKARFFFGCLEGFKSEAFENCSSLERIEVNTQYWRFLITEGLNLSAFVGTPKGLKVKLFNKEKQLRFSFVPGKYQIHSSEKRHFKENLSSLDKTKKYFILEDAKKQTKTKIDSNNQAKTKTKRNRSHQKNEKPKLENETTMKENSKEKAIALKHRTIHDEK